MQRGFKTGQLRRLEQHSKQYDRMLALLAILQHICPAQILEDAVVKAVREKYGNKLETTRLEDFFMAPKFISLDPTQSAQQHQTSVFVSEMKAQPVGRALRSYLKLYTRLSVPKLASFHDLSVEEFLPLLLSYKARMRQKELDGEFHSALDIHYYLEGEEVLVDEAEKQRRFENYFIGQIAQNKEIGQDAKIVDTKV
jgi:translation initiation factor 3 subunit L